MQQYTKQREQEKAEARLQDIENDIQVLLGLVNKIETRLKIWERDGRISK